MARTARGLVAEHHSMMCYEQPTLLLDNATQGFAEPQPLCVRDRLGARIHMKEEKKERTPLPFIGRYLRDAISHHSWSTTDHFLLFVLFKAH